MSDADEAQLPSDVKASVLRMADFGTPIHFISRKLGITVDAVVAIIPRSPHPRFYWYSVVRPMPIAACGTWPGCNDQMRTVLAHVDKPITVRHLAHELDSEYVYSTVCHVVDKLLHDGALVVTTDAKLVREASLREAEALTAAETDSKCN